MKDKIENLRTHIVDMAFSSSKTEAYRDDLIKKIMEDSEDSDIYQTILLAFQQHTTEELAFKKNIIFILEEMISIKQETAQRLASIESTKQTSIKNILIQYVLPISVLPVIFFFLTAISPKTTEALIYIIKGVK